MCTISALNAAQSHLLLLALRRDRNAKVPPNLRSRCPDIASQMVANALDYRVILGGGRREFLTKAQNGSRTEVDLIAKWKADQKAKGRRYRYIETGKELRNLEIGKTDYVLGEDDCTCVVYNV